MRQHTETFTLGPVGAGLTASIVPAFGANVSSLTLTKNAAPHRIIAGNTTAEDFAGKGVFRGAKLFPFPNRLKDGTYTFGSATYHMELNYPEEHNACHGFVYDKPFTIERETSGNGDASVTLAYRYDGSLTGYPFPFLLRVGYSLSEADGFSCETRVENTGTAPMPLGDGWHPFFTLGRKVDSLLLHFNAKELIEVGERSVPDGQRHVYDAFAAPEAIGEAAFDTCFMVQGDRRGIHTAELHDREADLTIGLWQETGKGKYNYLQVYTPPDRLSIALEPMSCNIDAFNNREGLITLKPGETFRGRYGVKLL